MKHFILGLLTIASIISYGQDIEVTGVSGPLTTVRYQEFSHSITIKNSGIVPITKPFATSVYLSTDNILQAGDTHIGYAGTTSLAAGETQTVQLSNAAVNIQPGSYYLIIYADPYLLISETDEGNNHLVLPGYVVQTPDIDFHLTSFTIDKSVYAANDKIRASCSMVKNGTTNVGGFLHVSYRLSADEIYDNNDHRVGGDATLIGTDGGIIDGEDFALPSVPPGNYYLVALLDPGSAFDETNESNNTISLPVEIVASDIDLEITVDNIWADHYAVTYVSTITNRGTTGVLGYEVFAVLTDDASNTYTGMRQWFYHESDYLAPGGAVNLFGAEPINNFSPAPPRATIRSRSS